MVYIKIKKRLEVGDAISVSRDYYYYFKIIEFDYYTTDTFGQVHRERKYGLNNLGYNVVTDDKLSIATCFKIINMHNFASKYNCVKMEGANHQYSHHCICGSLENLTILCKELFKINELIK